MIVKSFVLKQQSVGKIASLIDAQTVAVVRPQRKIEALFREAIRKTLQEKKQADDELVRFCDDDFPLRRIPCCG